MHSCDIYQLVKTGCRNRRIPEIFKVKRSFQASEEREAEEGGDATKDGRGRRKHNRLANEEEREMRPESSTR